MSNERKYLVNSGMRTNLESFRIRVLNSMYDMEYGETDEAWFLGKKYDVDTIYDLLEEVEQLQTYAEFFRVTGKEYGRIKEISNDQNWHRYNACISSGMDEDRASYAFM